jgi:hypothetical protein
VNEPAGWEVTADPSSRRWGELFEEQAILHGPEGEEAWFIRGNIEIPVEDGTRLTYTVWLSISQQNLERAHELWLDERRVQEPPYFAWLWADLPGYPPTRQLKTMLHNRPPGQRPLVELEPTHHPLSVEQRSGITTERLFHLGSLVLHGG